MNNKNCLTRFLGILSVGILTFLVGCSTAETTTVETSNSSTKAPSSGYGPSYSTFQSDGVTYGKGSMAFPTTDLSSSVILLTKTYPVEAMVGSQYYYDYQLENLTSFAVTDVVLTDRLSRNFNLASSLPPSTARDGDVVSWDIGELGPNEIKTVRVYGDSPAEGYFTTCGSVTFNPLLCETVQIVRADLQLVKSVQSDAVICDVIPYTFTVTNTGSSDLTNVIVSDDLPAGLTTVDGQTSLSFNAGDLAPGASETFTVDVRASSVGVYENVATATSAQGIEASDEAMLTIAAPELTITCDAPVERFVGRPVNVCYMVTNVGDAASGNTVVRAPIPALASFRGATAGGTVVGNEVVWNLGTVSASDERELCATFVGIDDGLVTFTGSASSDCADIAMTSCSTLLSGIPAILLEVIDLDDPIEVGDIVTYRISVTNQGSAPDTNITIKCILEAEQSFVSAAGATNTSSVTASTVDFAPLASLAAKAEAVWDVKIRADEAADVRFEVEMNSDEMGREVRETEATRQY